MSMQIQPTWNTSRGTTERKLKNGRHVKRDFVEYVAHEDYGGSVETKTYTNFSDRRLHSAYIKDRYMCYDNIFCILLRVRKNPNGGLDVEVKPDGTGSNMDFVEGPFEMKINNKGVSSYKTLYYGDQETQWTGSLFYEVTANMDGQLQTAVFEHKHVDQGYGMHYKVTVKCGGESGLDVNVEETAGPQEGMKPIRPSSQINGNGNRNKTLIDSSGKTSIGGPGSNPLSLLNQGMLQGNDNMNSVYLTFKSCLFGKQSKQMIGSE